MNVRITKLSRLAGVAALGLGLLGAIGCEEAAKQCGLECPSEGVAEGNASISGFAAIDGFFGSVANFGKIAGGVAGDIQVELDAIQAGFGLTDAQVSAAGSLGAAIQTKLETDFKASIVVDARPAECKVDASVSAQATVDCQAKAGCDVDPGKASVQCMGQCTVEASAEGTCEANAEVKCELSGPQLTCQGECKGSCEVELAAAASCEGTCKGACSGECVGDTDSSDNGCSGQCMGMCQGSCEVSGMAAAQCSGKCSGSCEYTPPGGTCEANANVKCDLMAEANAECKGSCEGEFEPPKADCEASASCEASAKADAKFQASCTPPSIDVRVDVSDSISADAEAQLAFAVDELKVHLPRLLASLGKADLVLDAGAELGADGAAAIKGTLNGVADGDVDLVAAYRIGTCVPGELDASAQVIADTGKKLSGQVEAAVSVTAAVGMGS